MDQIKKSDYKSLLSNLYHHSKAFRRDLTKFVKKTARNEIRDYHKAEAVKMTLKTLDEFSWEKEVSACQATSPLLLAALRGGLLTKKMEKTMTKKRCVTYIPELLI